MVGRESTQTARVERCGVLARQILADDREVQVAAVMPRAIYLAIGDDLVCIGGATLGSGPINVELTATIPVPSLRLEAGMRGHIASGLCRIGSHIAFDTRSGTTWMPPAMVPLLPERTARGLERLRVCAIGKVPSDGLAGLVLTQEVEIRRDALACMAFEPIACLRTGIADALSRGWQTSAIGAARALVGLGPGLTPSGDDVLGGLLMALHAVGRTELRDRLWRALAPELGALTGPISMMHLRAAAQGMASAPVHDLIDALLRGDDEVVADCVAAVARIGHTSGWDALAGLVLGLEAMLEAAPLTSAV